MGVSFAIRYYCLTLRDVEYYTNEKEGMTSKYKNSSFNVSSK